MKKIYSSFLLCFIISIFCITNAYSWGFYGHRVINRMAVYTLPPEMFGFYKAHIQYITENAVNPDRRRYAVEGEAPRHYLDMDIYGDSAWLKLPHRWKDAVEKYSEDTLMAYGIVPWTVEQFRWKLTNAMERGDAEAIIRLSADLGHYIGDSHVPLHSTENYNGQLTDQYGIHGFWESRLPELYALQYDFFVGKAEYIENTQERAWDAIISSHIALDSVLRFEKQLTKQMGDDQKWSYETRGRNTQKLYSRPFSKAYHEMLNGQVERRMKQSIKTVGDFWLTCWIDAGQPDLNKLLLSPQEQENLEKEMKELEPSEGQSAPTLPEKPREHEGH